MPSMRSSAWSLDSIVDSEPDRSVLSTCRFVSVAVEGRRRTCTALLEAHVAGLLDHTERVGDAGLVQLLTGGLAGEVSL